MLGYTDILRQLQELESNAAHMQEDINSLMQVVEDSKGEQERIQDTKQWLRLLNTFEGDEYDEQKKKREEMLNHISWMQRRVLTLHFIENKTYEQIAEECHYSVRQIHNIKDAGLLKLNEMI